ncbi:MAG: ferrous iron transporter B [Nitrospiraceae bacterium]|nr:MAG: ferrous iron transporter B [Nitrospiraceae bacterium]
MHDQCHKQDEVKSDVPSICLVGNPNVGKSAIFGLLTGRYVTVSNYPGTTVEITKGEAYIHKGKYQIIDTPGVNSLVPMSEDEKVTRDILLQKRSDTVVHVADSKNMKRSLFITIQLIEMGLPIVIDLNMRDEASSRGIDIDESALSEIFGLDVVSTIAVQKKGINTLKKVAVRPRISPFRFSYDGHIEEYISRIEPLIPESCISRRSVALMVLSGDRTLKGWLLDNLSKEKIRLIESYADKAAEKYSEPLSYVISQQRLKAVEEVAGKIIRKTAPQRKRVSAFFEEVTTHPAWGFPFLFAVLYLVYEFVGRFGAGTLVDFFEEIVFGEYLNPWAVKIVEALVPV